MIIEQICTGETVEDAGAAAKAMLNAPADAVIKTEILEMPKKKVLGIFGGSPAKVKVSYEVPDKKPQRAAKPAPAAKPMPKKQPAPAPKVVKAPAQGEAKETPVQKPAEIEKPKEEIAIASSPVLETAAAYVATIVKGMGIEKCDVKAFKVDDEIELDLDCGDDYGILIGKWGETLDSVQYLTRLAANRAKGGEDYPRISLNVGSYRQKRSQYLKDYAAKKAAGVRKYGRNATLEPMNPYERRIVHTAIQTIEGVTSFSIGSEGDRKVVITLEDGVKPLKPHQRSRSDRRRSDNRPLQKVESPARAPKTDAGAQGVGLYGKLN